MRRLENVALDYQHLHDKASFEWPIRETRDEFFNKTVHLEIHFSYGQEVEE